jgi:hypothetical protein
MESKAITNFGWVVEMRIPYAALLSGEKNKLGVLIFRNKTIPTKYTWNFIDSKLGTFSHNKLEFLKE